MSEAVDEMIADVAEGGEVQGHLGLIAAMTHSFLIAALRRILVVAGAGAFLASCSSPPVPTDTFYNLTAGRTVMSAGGSSISGTVEVPPFRAEGVVNEHAIVYRQSDTTQKQYTYHYWAEPPSIMLQRSLIDAVRASKAFDQAAPPEFRADRNYELIGTLRRLEHVVGSGSGKVVVEFDVGLRRVRGNDSLLLKTYRIERAAGRDVSGAVSAMSTGLDSLLSEMVKDIAAAGE